MLRESWPRWWTGYRAGLLVGAILFAGCGSSEAPRDIDREDWTPLVNGRDLDGWRVKIAGHDVGVNFANTFRFEDGLLRVRYDGYQDFNDRFGHLFFDGSFSHYRIRLEYRFVGEQQTGAPSWARRNSGIMLHAQSPRSMLRDQDFPIAIEMQFLGGLGDGVARPTGNMCSPGTEVMRGGVRVETHCLDSASETYDGDQWVRAEAVVLGDSVFVHLINGDTVLQYSHPEIGGGVVSGFDSAVKRDGLRLVEGFVALQSEGHPIDFRNIELLNLAGCMDPASSNYKSYFVASEPEACDRP